MCESVESHFRSLIYIPIIHTQADMGALQSQVKKASLKKFGLTGWKRKITLVDKYWTEIEKYIEGLSLPPGGVRIYQDALPVSGKERTIVEELAKSGSRNHILLLNLMDKGAVLTGTESLELLLEEYNHVKKTLEGQSVGTGAAEKRISASLLERRDKFIAKRINETLSPGELGIIFLGMLHSLEQWLDSDIHVAYPVHARFDPGSGRS